MAENTFKRKLGQHQRVVFGYRAGAPLWCRVRHHAAMRSTAGFAHGCAKTQPFMEGS